MYGDDDTPQAVYYQSVFALLEDSLAYLLMAAQSSSYYSPLSGGTGFSSTSSTSFRGVDVVVIFFDAPSPELPLTTTAAPEIGQIDVEFSMLGGNAARNFDPEAFRSFMTAHLLLQPGQLTILNYHADTKHTSLTLVVDMRLVAPMTELATALQLLDYSIYEDARFIDGLLSRQPQSFTRGQADVSEHFANRHDEEDNNEQRHRHHRGWALLAGCGILLVLSVSLACFVCACGKKRRALTMSVASEGLVHRTGKCSKQQHAGSFAL